MQCHIFKLVHSIYCRALAKKMGMMVENLGVRFENVDIYRATILPKTGSVALTVHLLPASNKFEVSEGKKKTLELGLWSDSVNVEYLVL